TGRSGREPPTLHKGNMDVLVVIGEGQPPERLRARAGHVVRAPTSELAPALVADLRTRIPRQVAVVGPLAEAKQAAAALHQAGLPVTLYTAQRPVLRGLDV